MSEPALEKESSLDELPADQPDLLRMVTALQRAKGFALFFARCNVPAYRAKLIEVIRNSLARPIAVIEIKPLADTENRQQSVDGYVEEKLAGVSEDAVVFVTGLENLLPSRDEDQMLATTQELNWRRGLFQKMRRPMVFWLPEYALTMLARNAPDLYDWYSGVYDLEIPHQMRSQMARTTLETISQTEDRRWIEKDERDRWEDVLQELLANAEANSNPDNLSKAAAVEQSDLLDRLGKLYRQKADYQKAKDYRARALKISEAAFGPNHPNVAIYLNNLASVLQDLGELQTARELLDRSLIIDEQALGLNHPNIARGLNNLGLVLRDLGELQNAKTLFNRALKIDEAAFGPNHSRVAIRLNNLAEVLRGLGELQNARNLLDRSLKISEAAFGSNHPNVAASLTNLAAVLKELGELQSARNLLDRSLKISEAAFGPNHPNVATSLNNLAAVLSDLGELRPARSLLERSLGILQQFLGNEHPNTKLVKENLDAVLKELVETDSE